MVGSLCRSTTCSRLEYVNYRMECHNIFVHMLDGSLKMIPADFGDPSNFTLAPP